MHKVKQDLTTEPHEAIDTMDAFAGCRVNVLVHAQWPHVERRTRCEATRLS